MEVPFTVVLMLICATVVTGQLQESQVIPQQSQYQTQPTTAQQNQYQPSLPSTNQQNNQYHQPLPTTQQNNQYPQTLTATHQQSQYQYPQPPVSAPQQTQFQYIQYPPLQQQYQHQSIVSPQSSQYQQPQVFLPTLAYPQPQPQQFYQVQQVQQPHQYLQLYHQHQPNSNPQIGQTQGNNLLQVSQYTGNTGGVQYPFPAAPGQYQQQLSTQTPSGAQISSQQTYQQIPVQDTTQISQSGQEQSTPSPLQYQHQPTNANQLSYPQTATPTSQSAHQTQPAPNPEYYRLLQQFQQAMSSANRGGAAGINQPQRLQLQSPVSYNNALLYPNQYTTPAAESDSPRTQLTLSPSPDQWRGISHPKKYYESLEKFRFYQKHNLQPQSKQVLEQYRLKRGESESAQASPSSSLYDTLSYSAAIPTSISSLRADGTGAGVPSQTAHLINSGFLQRPNNNEKGTTDSFTHPAPPAYFTHKVPALISTNALVKSPITDATYGLGSFAIKPYYSQPNAPVLSNYGQTYYYHPQNNPKVTVLRKAPQRTVLVKRYIPEKSWSLF